LYYFTVVLRGGGPLLGFAVGGANDINNFRQNIDNDYLPVSTDISYEGLFNDYFFDTGDTQKESDSQNLFYPTYSVATAENPLERDDQHQKIYEYYMAVGLNSNLNESTFKRNPINLLICIDRSGSMASPFNCYYYDRQQTNRYIKRVQNLFEFLG
jgi:Ca-activated chloride channel homolog